MDNICVMIYRNEFNLEMYCYCYIGVLNYHWYKLISVINYQLLHKSARSHQYLEKPRPGLFINNIFGSWYPFNMILCK